VRGRGREREGGERDPQGKFNNSSTGREERGREGKKGKGVCSPNVHQCPPELSTTGDAAGQCSRLSTRV